MITLNEQLFLDCGYLHARQLEDGAWVAINQQIYTTGLVVDLDATGYSFRYCYEKRVDAVKAYTMMLTKDEIPYGPWIKRKGEGGEILGPGAKDVGGR